MYTDPWNCLYIHLENWMECFFPTVFRLSDTPMNFPSYFFLCVFLDHSYIHCNPVAHVAGTVATFASLRIARRTNPSSACGSWDLPNALKEEVYRLDILIVIVSYSYRCIVDGLDLYPTCYKCYSYWTFPGVDLWVLVIFFTFHKLHEICHIFCVSHSIMLHGLYRCIAGYCCQQKHYLQ